MIGWLSLLDYLYAISGWHPTQPADGSPFYDMNWLYGLWVSAGGFVAIPSMPTLFLTLERCVIIGFPNPISHRFIQRFLCVVGAMTMLCSTLFVCITTSVVELPFNTTEVRGCQAVSCAMVKSKNAFALYTRLTGELCVLPVYYRLMYWKRKVAMAKPGLSTSNPT